MPPGNTRLSRLFFLLGADSGQSPEARWTQAQKGTAQGCGGPSLGSETEPTSRAQSKPQSNRNLPPRTRIFRQIQQAGGTTGRRRDSGGNSYRPTRRTRQ